MELMRLMHFNFPVTNGIKSVALILNIKLKYSPANSFMMLGELCKGKLIFISTGHSRSFFFYMAESVAFAILFFFPKGFFYLNFHVMDLRNL